MVERLFHAVPRGCLQFVIVVFPGHTHLLFLMCRVQGHNAVRSLRLEPAVTSSQEKIEEIVRQLYLSWHCYSAHTRLY